MIPFAGCFFCLRTQVQEHFPSHTFLGEERNGGYVAFQGAVFTGRSEANLEDKAKRLL